MKPPYRPELKRLARDLRNHSTLAEILLWKQLKGKQRLGFDFHRQRPIDDYIVDFFSPALRLAIEIDGETHRFKGEDDAQRQRRLEARGIRFLRFGDAEVKHNMAGVLAEIDRWIASAEGHRTDGGAKHTPASGHPSPEGTSDPC
jgi:very-short-patch-repair endonuclease